MQDVHITFPLAQFHAMIAAFEEQFAAQQAAIVIVDCGCSYKQERGYIVIEWEGSVDEDFLAQLQADASIEDFCVYDVPCMAMTDV